MTSYKILNTVFRTTTAFILIGASITVPLSAAATAGQKSGRKT